MELWVTIIGSLITGAATLGSVWLARHYVKKKQNPVVDDTAQSANVYTALKYTLGEMGADRAYVLEFHNGGHYYSGRGQQKYSCTHETVSEGISHECDISQEHRVSNHHAYISELVEYEKFAYIDIRELEDHAFLHLLKKSGVKSIYNVPIKTLNGKIIGILGVDFVKNPATQNALGFEVSSGVAAFNEESFSFMKKQARIMAGYLV